ncbi:MAG TPA: hypothetical protein VGD80_26250 [Kofleriaceae bacterium]
MKTWCWPWNRDRTRCAPALAIAWLAGACSNKPEPPPARSEGRAEEATADVTGTLTVDGAAARPVRCRPAHAVHVYVEVDTALGTLGFREGKLFWNGTEKACSKLDRSWGGGIRADGSAYFRGTLAFRCEGLVGDLSLDCGQITPDEGAELAKNRAAATPAPVGPAGSAGGSGH